MKLRCPNNPDHKEFVMTGTVVLEIRGATTGRDVISARAETIADSTEARCQECSALALVVIEEE